MTEHLGTNGRLLMFSYSISSKETKNLACDGNAGNSTFKYKIDISFYYHNNLVFQSVLKFLGVSCC